MEVSIYKYMYEFMHLCCIYMYVCIYVCMYVLYVCMYVSMCTCVWMDGCIHVMYLGMLCIYICRYVCIYVCIMYVCM